MPLINCEINLLLIWSADGVIIAGAKKLKKKFKRTTDWNKYQSKTSNQTQNWYLDYLINPSFQGVNTRFVSSSGNDAYQTSYKQYFPATVEIKDFNVMIDGRNIFDQPAKSDQRTNNKVWKITTGQWDNSLTDCLLDYVYFKKYDSNGFKQTTSTRCRSGNNVTN